MRSDCFCNWRLRSRPRIFFPFRRLGGRCVVLKCLLISASPKHHPLSSLSLTRYFRTARSTRFGKIRGSLASSLPHLFHITSHHGKLRTP